MGGGTTGNTNITAVNALRWSAISSVTADDFLHISVQRVATDAADTWNAAWELWGLEVTFA